MKRHLVTAMRLSVVAAGGIVSMAAGNVANAQLGTVLYSENFDELAPSLQPSVNERLGSTNVTRVATDPSSVPYPNAFTHTGPTGWTVDNGFDPQALGLGTFPNAGVPGAGDPNYGVDEWEGWSFANKDFWVNVAGDQNRSQFAKGSGTVLVADPDEYDDMNNVPRQGFYNTAVSTNAINVAAYHGQTLNFKFDSSWRAEAFDDDIPSKPAFTNTNNQSGIVYAQFDGGAPQALHFRDSDPVSPFYQPDATNETVNLPVTVPAGATTMKLTFGLYNAGNDWFWAADNLDLTDASNNHVWSENFDEPGSVTLHDSVNERNAISHVTKVQTDPNSQPVQNAFTHTPPAGWNVNNSGGVPGIGDPNVGVEEWEGWTFTKPSFWTFVKDSNRSQFTKGTGLIAVADPDDWDALGSAGDVGTFNSLLESPLIDITGVAPGKLELKFDSSWRPEDTQTAIITVDYGNGETEVLRWESDSASPKFHADDTNGTILLMLDNPAGATHAKIRFGMINATDDWFWGIDNVQVGVAVPEPTSVLLMGLGAVGIGAVVGAKRRRN